MKDLLEHIDKLKKQLAQLQPLSTETQQKLDKKFRMEWNYNSNHIEGNTLTYGETELLLIFGETKGNHEFREYEEMKGHDVALKLIEDLAFDKERNLSENFIREVNKAILKEPYYKEAITPDGQPTRRLIKIGEYKSFPNSVLLQNGEMFNYASPAETAALMGDLVAWYLQESANKEKHPIEVAAELHYKFVCIHPFDDGNGRISRLLMNYHLLKNDYPPVIIKSADKKNYLFALHEADTGNIEAFKSYIAEQLIWSYEISIKAAKGESIDEYNDFEKEVELLKRKIKTNEIISLKKNKELIKNIILNEMIFLFNSIKNNLSHFDELFNETQIHIEIDDAKWAIKVEKQITRLADERVNDNTIKFAFSYHLNKNKYNSFDIFSIAKKVLVDFNEFYYEIFYSDTQSEFNIRKTYAQKLSEEEIFTISSSIRTSVFNEIKIKTLMPPN